MEYELTKNEGILIDLMRSRGVNSDSCCGVMLTLETETNIKKMLRWIKKNPQAGQYEIIGYLDEICPIPNSKPAQKSASKSISSRIKKIAVF